MDTTTQESAPLMWVKTWKPFLRWFILRTDLRDPLKHVQITLRLAREPEKRTAISLGCRIAGVAWAAIASSFEWLRARPTTFQLEDEHALTTNAAASTNTFRPRDLTEGA